MHTSKSLHWQEISQHVSQFVDALGQPIDPGIHTMVVALNAHGVQTLASCEGHRDHGIAAPWVDIGDPQAHLIAKEAHRLLLRGENVQAEQKRLESQRLHFQQYQRLVPLLDAFYQERNVPFTSRLIFTQEWSGILRLQSQGAAFQDVLDQTSRSQALQTYQQEMHEFAGFLQATFMTE